MAAAADANAPSAGRSRRRRDPRGEQRDARAARRGKIAKPGFESCAPQSRRRSFRRRASSGSARTSRREGHEPAGRHVPSGLPAFLDAATTTIRATTPNVRMTHRASTPAAAAASDIGAEESQVEHQYVLQSGRHGKKRCSSDTADRLTRSIAMPPASRLRTSSSRSRVGRGLGVQLERDRCRRWRTARRRARPPAATRRQRRRRSRRRSPAGTTVIVDRALRDDLAVIDDRRRVARALHLVEQVRDSSTVRPSATSSRSACACRRCGGVEAVSGSSRISSSGSASRQRAIPGAGACPASTPSPVVRPVA